MTSAPKRRRHAAARARKLAAVVSVVAFAAIGQAINLASRATTTAQTGAVSQTAGSPSLLAASRGTASVSAVPATTAVTGTHAS